MPGSALVRGWLRLVHALASGPARLGVPPSAVTVLGLLVTAAAVPAAAAGGRWPVLAAALVGVGGLLDGLDGPVAVLQHRESRTGALLDSTADRLGEIALGAVLLVLGAPGWLVAAGVALGWLVEYVRVRAATLGATEVGVTVGERPTRMAVVGMFALGAGVQTGKAELVALVGGWVLAAAGAVALVQVWTTARRRLR